MVGKDLFGEGDFIAAIEADFDSGIQLPRHVSAAVEGCHQMATKIASLQVSHRFPGKAMGRNRQA
jgi:hypothetical protein